MRTGFADSRQGKKMQKMFAVLIAGVLVAGLCSQAQAYFTPGDLIRVMVDTATHMEVATDLGPISTLSTLSNGTVYALQADGANNAITIGQLNDTSWANVKTAYFAYSSSGTLLYIAGAGSLTPTAANSAGNFTGNAGSVLGLYAKYSTIFKTGSTWGLSYSGIPNSYYAAMDGNGSAVGTMGGYLNSASALLTEVNNGVQSSQTVYIFNNSNTLVAGATMAPGISIQTYQGTTDIESVPLANPSPIPPSILFLGSGLAGLIGVYKRGRLFRPCGLNEKGGGPESNQESGITNYERRK
jgi:hypothetical protein